MKNIRVLIADDHPLIKEGLIKVLSLDKTIEVVAEANNGEDTIRITKEVNPDVILMDLNMPVIDGIEATKIIKKEMPGVGIIALTVEDNNDKFFEVMQAGVNGYVLKDISPEMLVACIKAVYAGETVIHHNLTSKIIFQSLNHEEGGQKSEKEEPLTEREIEILKLIAKGKNNRDIANTLYISEKTVKNHITNIFKKINVVDRTQAALYAIKAKLVDLE